MPNNPFKKLFSIFGIYGIVSFIALILFFSSLYFYEDDRTEKINKIVSDNSILKSEILGQIREVVITQGDMQYSFEFQEPVALKYSVHKVDFKISANGYVLVIEKVTQ